jgi:ankyrin repeat protein
MQDGATALMVACQYGHDIVATLLLEKGAGANQAMDNTVTPLMYAAHFGHLSCVEALLSHGAVVLTAMTGDNADLEGAGPGSTATRLATIAGHDDIVAILTHAAQL